jgi:adenylate cyclase
MARPEPAKPDQAQGTSRGGSGPAIVAYLVTLTLLVAVARFVAPGANPLAAGIDQVIAVAGALLAALLAAWLPATRPAAAPSVNAEAGNPPPTSAPPLSDMARASIAVLPLESLSRDEDDELLARGFSAEIIRALSGVPDLRVVPHVQSAAYAGRRLHDVARELDVRYVMSGSLQRTAGRMRLIVMLTDAANGQQVWSESFEKDLHDLFQVQRDVAEAIAIETGSRFLNIISDDLCRQAPQGLSAWSLTHKALTFWTMNYTREASTEAIEWLEQAIRLEPTNAMAHVMLGFVLNQRVVNSFSEDPHAENQRALAEVDAAMRLAPRDATVMEYATLVWLNCGMRSRSLQMARRVVTIAPFNMVAWGYLGCDLAWGGSPAEIEEGVAILHRLLKVAPHHPSVPFWHFFLAVGYAEAGDYAKSREHAQAAVGFHPGFCLGWATLGNALGELGDFGGAREAIGRAVVANPLFRLEGHQRYMHAISGETPNTPPRQTGGLIKAGLLQPWQPESGG